jgi:magnesium transporter
MVRFPKKPFIMSNGSKKRSGKKGLPPGTLVHVGRKSDKIRVSLIDYNEDDFIEREIVDFSQVWPPKEGYNRWIMVEGVSDTDLVSRIGTMMGLNPLMMEDIVNTEQRPKFDDYGDIMMLTLRSINIGKDGEFLSEQISLVAGKKFLISFQEHHHELFMPIIDRIRKSTGSIRNLGHDYLLYALTDLVVDNYFDIIEHFGEQIEVIEEQISSNPTGNIPSLTQQFKKDLFSFRKAIVPLREALHKMIISDKFLMHEKLRFHLNDIYDHVLYILDSIEMNRDLINELKDNHLMQLSNRMNKIMQLLTAISTVFIPLTFVVGVYGMNFRYMPELEWKFGYLMIWIVILLSGIGMFIYFKRRKWL